MIRIFIGHGTVTCINWAWGPTAGNVTHWRKPVSMCCAIAQHMPRRGLNWAQLFSFPINRRFFSQGFPSFFFKRTGLNWGIAYRRGTMNFACRRWSFATSRTALRSHTQYLICRWPTIAICRFSMGCRHGLFNFDISLTVFVYRLHSRDRFRISQHLCMTYILIYYYFAKRATNYPASGMFSLLTTNFSQSYTIRNVTWYIIATYSSACDTSFVLQKYIKYYNSCNFLFSSFFRVISIISN